MLDNRVVLTIKWTVQDFEDALREAGKKSSLEQVQELIGQAKRDLEDQSIERGWQVLEHYAKGMA